MKEYSLSEYDANILVASRRLSDYFEVAAKQSKNAKSVANWIMTEIFSRLTEEQKEEAQIPIKAEMLAELVNLIEQDVISNSIGKKVFASMWETGKSPSVIVEEEGLKQISDDGELIEMAKEVIAKNDKVVKDYLSGREQAIQSLMGQMMKLTKGKANPKKVIDLLKSILDEMK